MGKGTRNGGIQLDGLVILGGEGLLKEQVAIIARAIDRSSRVRAHGAASCVGGGPKDEGPPKYKAAYANDLASRRPDPSAGIGNIWGGRAFAVILLSPPLSTREPVGATARCNGSIKLKPNRRSKPTPHCSSLRPPRARSYAHTFAHWPRPDPSADRSVHTPHVRLRSISTAQQSIDRSIDQSIDRTRPSHSISALRWDVFTFAALALIYY